MKRVLGTIVLSACSAIAHAHPGVHHLNGVGHSLAGFETILAVSGIALWAVVQAQVIRTWLRRLSGRRTASKGPRTT